MPDVTKSQPTLHPPSTTINKRKSDGDLNEEYRARVDEKKKERKKKDHYVQQKPRLRKRQLGEQYCCQCDAQKETYDNGIGSVCNFCRHQRCVECLAK